MKILLRRHVKTASAGMLGGSKTTYALDIRAELTPEEQATLDAYKPLWMSILYQPSAGEASLLPIPTVQLPESAPFTVSLKNAVDGMTYETKDPTQPLAIISQIKERAKYLKKLLAAAGDFTGEELVEV